MPEPAVAEGTASAISPAIPAGGDGAALTDDQILGLGAEEALPVEAVKEPEAAPGESAAEGQETTPEAEQPLEELAGPAPVPDWMKPFLADKTAGPKLQSMYDRLNAYAGIFPTVADARTFKELVPGGSEELKTLVAKSQEVDEMDLAYFSGDGHQRRSFAENLQREDPQAFSQMTQIGFEVIKARDPQNYQQMHSQLVSEALVGDKVWDWLEYIHGEATKAGATDVANLLNNFAGTFQKYGLGPHGKQESPEALRIKQDSERLHQERQDWDQQRFQEFRETSDKEVRSAVDAEIKSQVAKLLPKVSEWTRNKLSQDIHQEVEAAARKDTGLRLQLQNLIRSSGINRATQQQVVNLLSSKAKTFLTPAVKRIIGEYTDQFVKSRKETADKRAAAASRVDISSGAAPGTGMRKPLTKEEARKMTPEEILNSDRPVAS